MKLWARLTRTNPNSRVPFSTKVLIYASLTAFFGWSLIIFFFAVLGMDPVHNPYGLPIASAGLCFSALCLSAGFMLWVASFSSNLDRWGRNLLITLAVTAVLFYPTIYFWGLMSRVFDHIRPILDTMYA